VHIYGGREDSIDIIYRIYLNKLVQGGKSNNWYVPGVLVILAFSSRWVGRLHYRPKNRNVKSIFGKPVFYSNLVERVTDDIISVSGALNGTSFKIL